MKPIRILFSICILFAIGSQASAQITNAQDLLDSLFMSDEIETESQRKNRKQYWKDYQETQDYTLLINGLNKELKRA